MKNICKLLNINQFLSTLYRHETIGPFKHTYRTLSEEFLKVNLNQEWTKLVNKFTLAFNTTLYIVTQYFLYGLVCGKLPYLSNDSLESLKPMYGVDNYAHELKLKSKDLWKIVNKILESEKQ